ncbi:protein kinase [Streptosporangium sp. NBC_01495]|uniref:serine/threonine protein kinase n=1 Tax=Streptosporangium sp. NBC_01495 TaxID=2903899 RepID=UPI002E32D926|nr:protein kinase [Streptosporangium sp. NBC_01495]
MPQAENLRDSDPAVVGPYRLSGRLGEGGQGLVYLGQAPDGRLVAIKVLRDGLAGDDRFAKEVAAARRVEPFCIAQVLDASLGTPSYIVTEYVEGPSLQEAGRLGGADLQRLAVATATALASIHQAGVVHRDFKPGNVLLGHGGPRVIDFGIARTSDTAATMTSSVVGTPAYMAPEQIAGEVVGPATDVFAWASVMVYVATGKPPFGDDTLPAIINRILHNEPQLGDLPQPLRSLVYGCLAKDPRARPTMRDVLLHLLGGSQPAAHQYGGPQPDGPHPGAQQYGGPQPGGPGMGPANTAPGRGRAKPRRGVNIPLVAGGGAVVMTAIVGAAVWFLPLLPLPGTLAAPGDDRPTPSAVATSPTGSTPKPTRTQQRAKKTLKPKATATPTRTRREPSPEPTVRLTPTRTRTPSPSRSTKAPPTSSGLRILRVYPQGQPELEGCWDEFAAFGAKVEANKPSVKFNYAWVLDGKQLESRSSNIDGDGYTGFVASGAHLVKPGSHTLTFRITSPVSKTASTTFTICSPGP